MMDNNWIQIVRSALNRRFTLIPCPRQRYLTHREGDKIRRPIEGVLYPTQHITHNFTKKFPKKEKKLKKI